jgi:hypothetical protein
MKMANVYMYNKENNKKERRRRNGESMPKTRSPQCNRMLNI